MGAVCVLRRKRSCAALAGTMGEHAPAAGGWRLLRERTWRLCVSSRRAFVTQCAALSARQQEQRARKTARVSLTAPGSGAMVKVRGERRHVHWSVNDCACYVDIADAAAARLLARWRMSGAAPKGAIGATMEKKGEDHRSKKPTTLFFKKSWSRTTICRQLPVLERAT